MEHELVAAARRGDQAAFMDLVRPRSNRLFAIALQILRDIDRAEDALQDALVIAWRDLRERRRAVNLRVLPIDGPAAPDDLLSIADRDQLERGFRRLPPDQRAILVLHHFLGYPPSEIAETLGIPPGTARSRLYNAHRASQHEIGDLPYGDPNVSPDGTTLLMLHGRGDEGREQALFTADMSGDNVQQITSYALDAEGTSDWAPDGSRITTSDNANIPEHSANVVTVPADGGEPFYVTDYSDPDVRAYVGGYSPDGNWIVFRLEDHGQHALRLVRANGTGLRTILPLSDFRPRGIDWGPAASKQLFDRASFNADGAPSA
jgi:DNA-directed RNA polymerase specialized sigma24 family protein